MYVATASPRPKRSAFDSSRGGNVPCVPPPPPPPPWIRHCVLTAQAVATVTVCIALFPALFSSCRVEGGLGARLLFVNPQNMQCVFQ